VFHSHYTPQARLQNHNQSLEDQGYRKGVSLEALLSPTHSNPFSVPHRTVRDDTAASDSETAIGVGRRGWIENAEAPSFVKKEDSVAKNGRLNKSVFPAKASKTTDKSDLSLEETIPKPTVVSLGEITWDLVRTTSSTFTTPRSSLSPAHSPQKGQRTVQNTVTSSPADPLPRLDKSIAKGNNWGSLGRPSTLQGLSLPLLTHSMNDGQAVQKHFSFPFSFHEKPQSPKMGGRSLTSSPTKHVLSLQFPPGFSSETQSHATQTKKPSPQTTTPHKERTPTRPIALFGECLFL